MVKLSKSLYRLHRLARMAQKPALPSSIEKYVFIVSFGRSGSTLLQKMLGGLPGFHIAGENFGSVFKLADGWSRLGEANDRHGEGPVAYDNPWYGAAEIEADRLGTRLAETIVEDVIRPPAGTRVAGFKEIRWLVDEKEFEASIRFLSRFLAPAYFVLNTRSPQAVAKSGWWRDRPLEQTLELVAGWNERLAAHAAGNPANSLLMSYDRYVSDPEAFRPLFEFLGEPYDRAYVDGVLGERLTHSGVPG